ncbi:ankyrin repeat domain-containing protein [Aspergillus candidus]|uniref:Ankyrin repeat-containing domain protein n=1 Tax=Aspergillus candidus TaxID=41067 RepID=A0A2I2F7C6_ASPCN|nr:ankyrin repeat-containing domain protein [Aspergillus candidus]PLB36535.1 ankyrin repeat-containing domain protein [Aspergillus candidus]
MALNRLPEELSVMIAEQLDEASDINSFAQSNRLIYPVVNHLLYTNNIHRAKASALSWGAKHNSLGTIEISMSMGAAVYKRWETAPLAHAARAGHAAAVELLLSHGANPDSKDSETDQTPLYIASEYGYPAVCEKLLAAGADVSSRNQRTDQYTCDQTPLHTAALHGNVLVAQLLINHGADINAPNDKGWVPLRESLRCEDPELQPRMVRLLLDAGAPVDGHPDHPRVTPLLLATIRFDDESVKTLLEAGADPNARDWNNGTALIDSVIGYRRDSVRLLLEYGADVDARADYGGRPLYLAARYGDLEITSLLLDYGADIDLPATSNEPALHVAALRNELETVRLLLQRGANAESLRPYGSSGFTALFLVARCNFIDVARVLLEYGANPLAVSPLGSTPLDAAKEEGHDEMVSLFHEHVRMRGMLAEGNDAHSMST